MGVAAIGKIKTVVQMVALLCLLYSVTPEKPPRPEPWLGGPIFHVGDWLLAVAALLTLWSGVAYLRAAWPVLRAGEGVAVDTPVRDVKIPPLPRE